MENAKLILAFIGLLMVIIVLICGVGFILQYFDGRKGKFTKKGGKKYVTFTKRKFNMITNHAIIWVYLSFVLAFLDKISIAEAISVQAIITIIGAFISYCAKSAYEKKIGKEKEENENISEEAYQ